MIRPAFIVIALTACTATSYGQIRDDFSDRDLSVNPPWIGETSYWRTGELRGSPALQSAGEARSDTISLSLHTGAAYGSWELTFGHQAVNLSTFNGARVFLTANTPDPLDAIEGYYVQIGTNNSDAISLWRVDGSLQRRVELARSANALVDGDSSYLKIRVVRDHASRWTVAVNDSVALEAVDDRYSAGAYFTVWVKHTAAGADSFFFDDFIIDAETPGPPPPPPPSSEPSPRPSHRDVVVNEVLFDPLPGGSEFFELYNRADSSFELSRFTFRDSRSAPLDVADESTNLKSGEYMVVAADAEAFSNQFRRTAFIAPSRWAALNNGGDYLVLEFDGQPIDSVAYDDDSVPTGFSLERIDPDGPSDPYNFLPSQDPFGATPGRLNSVYEPDDSGPWVLFAEEVDPRTIMIYFDEPIDPSSLNSETVSIGDATPDSVSATSSSTFTLFYSSDRSDPIVELARVVDRRGNVSEYISAPVALIPQPGDIIVNEIMYEPTTDRFDGQEDQSEYIEIYNRSARLISLSRLHVTRRTDENGFADTIDASLPLTSIPPQSFYLIARDSSLSGIAGEVLFSVAPVSLPNNGDLLRLHHPLGMLIDSLAYDPDLHHPDLIDSRGIALERIDVHGPGTDPTNWTSSVDPYGGTPGRPNSVSVQARPPQEAMGLSVSPNPFSPDQDGHEDVVAIAFHVGFVPALIRARVFSHEGIEVRRLASAQLVAESGALYWDGLDNFGRRLRSGIYIVLLEALDSGRKIKASHRAAVVLARRY